MSAGVRKGEGRRARERPHRERVAFNYSLRIQQFSVLSRTYIVLVTSRDCRRHGDRVTSGNFITSPEETAARFTISCKTQKS